MNILALGILAYLLYVLQQYVYIKVWDKNLFVTVLFDVLGVTEGENAEVIEIIENKKRLPLTMLKVKFQTSRNLEFDATLSSKKSDQYYRSDVFQISGGERITRRLPFKAAKRGYYCIKNIDMVCSDIFLSREMYKSMGTDSYVYVYPKAFQSDDFAAALQKLNGEVLVKRHTLEDPFEFRGIREYQPFDEIRSVNWKATAKAGGLMVNQKNYTSMETISVFLNTEDSGILKKEQQVEGAVQIVMGIVSFFLAQGIKVALFANGRDIITGETICLNGGAGIGQLDAVRKALSRLDTGKNPEQFGSFWEHHGSAGRDNNLHIFVSPNAYADFLTVLKQCNDRKTEYLWLYPYCGSEKPQVPEEIKQKVQLIKLDGRGM